MNAFKLILGALTNLIIYALALLLPIAFTPLTTEFYDTAKLIFLGISVLVLLLIWGARLISENRVIIVKTPLDLLFILFLIVAVLSTFLSPTPSVALFGLLPKVHGSLIFQVSIVLLYFMVVSNLRNVKQILTVSQILVFSGLILALVSLLSYFKVFLPFPAAQFTNFSLAGSSTATAIFLSMLLPLCLTQFLKASHSRDPLRSLIFVFYLVCFFVFIVTIVLIGNLASWIASMFAIGLVLYFNFADKGTSGLKSPAILPLLFTAALAILILILSYTPTIKDQTPLGKLASSFNREIQLPFDISWKISAGAFREYPILGSGPATYVYNFTQYKPIEYNQTPFWNLRLNSAHNQFLQTWAEMGGAGVLILVLISITFVVYGLKNRDPWGLTFSGITFILLMALSPMTVLTGAGGFLLLALAMASNRSEQKHEMIVDLSGYSGSLGNSGRTTHYLIPSLLFLPIIAITVVGFLFLGKLALGEFYHRQALNSVSQNKALDAYNQLIASERANDRIDLYRVDLANTNFALANSIASQKGPTEASPGGSLTDQDRTNIQQLLQQAIAEGRAAVALSPRSAANWEVLALIYRQIQGVAQNATAFSLDAYGRAIALDPLNPLLRLAVGGVYFQAKNYDLAIRFFDDAVALKPDYPNALYNLAIALKEKGNLTEAVRVTERLVAILQDKPDSQDYKTASQLLSDLKAQAPAENQPPAATPSAALEKQNLPKVLDLPNPDRVATPPAVRR